MNRVEALHFITAQLSRGELIFPTNVNASLKIQQALDDPNCSIETAAKLVITEPLLAARLVAIANSVAYSRFGGGVTNVKTAVTVLGFSTMRSIVASVVIRQLNNAISDPVIRQLANQLWEHSAHVAALAHVLARKVSRIDCETAMFAGIVHEVGSFYLLSRAQEFPALLDLNNTTKISDMSALADPLDEPPEVLIGRAVLHKLMVPKTIIAAMEALWYGVPAIPPKTLGDTLLLANQLTPVASPLESTVLVAVMDDAVGSAIDFAVGDSTLSAIVEESGEEIRSLTAALLL